MVDDKTRYLHRDHLGSVDVITREDGTEAERLSYDAHGKRRQTDWRPALGLILPIETPRGFTGHEHLDKLGLIHMNGRVYDPELGRFLSADPGVQFPAYTQSFNRYSYVLNNPLSFTDPSGFFIGDVIDAIDDALDDAFDAIGDFFENVGEFFTKTTVGRLIGGALATIAGGAIGYAAFNGLVTAVHGGSLGDVLASAALSFATVMVVGTMTGGCMDGCTLLASAMVAGAYMAEAQVQAEIREVDGAQSTTAKIAAGATDLYGGAKFANGAATAAFARLFNDVSLTAQKFGNWVGNHLDELQIGLSGLGMTPVVGIVFDALNVSISVIRGDFAGASLDVATMVPGAGQAAAPFAIAHRAGKFAKKGAKPSLSAHKEALKKVHKEVGGSLPKGKSSKFGSPQRGTPKKGY